MWMDSMEIVGYCRRNGSCYENLKVLSELNACSVKQVEEVLKSYGCVRKGDSWKIPNDRMDAISEANRNYTWKRVPTARQGSNPFIGEKLIVHIIENVKPLFSQATAIRR